MPFPKPSPRALAVISSAIVLSLSAGYIALAWTEPVGTMPVTVAAPLNTGGFAQTKTGDLALTGTLTASSFIDFDNNSYHVNPSGQTVLAGPVGIGTTVPYASLNIGGNGTNISNKGLIVGTVGDSIFTNIPLNGETGRFEIGFPGWRDTEPLQIGAKIAAIRKNVYQDNNALIQSTDLVFFTGSGTTGVNNPAFHDTSTEKFRITSDGKVVINNGGQLCIGTACANSTTWNSMISGAGSGGGGGTIGMAVEEPTCAWNSIDSGGALGSCIPASCQSGFTDAGISCEANGITGAYMTGQFHQSTVGSCQRICSSNITGGSASGGFAHLQVLTATGTFTIPAGVAKVYVELYGAGGGGGSGNYGASGSGGGAGGVVTGFLTVSPGQNISVTTGSGGSVWAAGGQSSLTYASNTIYAYGG